MTVTVTVSAVVAVTSGLQLTKLLRRSAGCACPGSLLEHTAAAVLQPSVQLVVFYKRTLALI
jgi:hypothetical protein